MSDQHIVGEFAVAHKRAEAKVARATPTRRERAETILRQARAEWLRQQEQVSDDVYAWICDRCGSDLERMYLAAVFFMDMGGGDASALPVIEFVRSLSIEPQKKVGPYTIDFALSVAPDRWFTGQAPVFVAVECDGEYFHDRTSKQVERDRARDRYLNMHGWRVLRFSEREIVKDAHKCAAETKQFIENIMHEQCRNDQRERPSE